MVPLKVSFRQQIFENPLIPRNTYCISTVSPAHGHPAIVVIGESDVRGGLMPSALAKSRPNQSAAMQTLNASVLAQLRSDIVACRLMPNERLRVEALRDRYGMGISPIREALMRLEAEGLVELEQNKGFRVAEVSRENLFDLMRTRIEIESIALRWSLEKGGVEWEADLLGAFHRLSRQTKVDPDNPDAFSQAWRKEHADFHMALVDACGSPTLLSIRSRLFEQTERYVVLSIMSNAPPRDDVAEHKQLMRAALSREIDKAVDLNRTHITRTLDKVAASLALADALGDTQTVSRKTIK
jgi:GntR family transcriptional regulator, carbon starvation induced regulator